MNVCFLLDTNPSMGKPLGSSRDKSLSLTALDAAKSGVEKLVMQMRLMGFKSFTESSLLLAKSGEHATCLLSTLGTGLQSFEAALKNISCSETQHSLRPALEITLQTLQKYRLKNGVDNLGKGWVPWKLEQSFIFVLTNDVNLMKLLSDVDSAWSVPAQHWDQKIFVYEIGSKGPTIDNDNFSDVVKLCKTSGGSLKSFLSYKDFLRHMTEMSSRLMSTFHSSPLVTVSLLLPEDFEVFASINVVKAGEWPLPEGQWVDRTVESLHPRPTFPQLVISSYNHPRDDSSSANREFVFTSKELQEMLASARSNGLIADSYEVYSLYIDRVCSETSTSAFEKNKLSNVLGKEWRGVYVNHSNRNPSYPPPLCGILKPTDIQDSSSNKASIELVVLPYNFPLLFPLLTQAKETAVAQGGKVHTKSNGSIILPAIRDPYKSLSNTWQSKMKAYLLSVPPYYFHSLYRAFQPLGIHVFISILTGGATAAVPHPDNSISRQVNKALKKAQSAAISEIKLIEKQLFTQQNKPLISMDFDNTQRQWTDEVSEYDSCTEISDHGSENGLQPTSKSSVSTLRPCFLNSVNSSPAKVGSNDMAEQRHAQQGCRPSSKLQGYLNSMQLPLQKSSFNIPSGNGETLQCDPIMVPPDAQDLLYTWEQLRGRIFGNKGGGSMVSSMHVAGRMNATGGSIVSGGKNGNIDGQKERDWFFDACGGATVPRLLIQDMGKFQNVLIRKEALRDPELLHPPEDENKPEEILRRKLTVNFGNPYKLLKTNKSASSAQNSSNMSIDVDEMLANDIIPLNDNSTESFIRTSTNAPRKNSDGNTKSKRSFDEFRKSLAKNNESKKAPRMNVSSHLSSENSAANTEQSTVSSTHELDSVSSKKMKTNTSDLPDGWCVKFSKKHQREYWFNSTSGKSQWLPPE